MSKQFSDIGINKQIQENLAALQISAPTEIQKQTIPIILNQKEDVVALAKTGTGKTAAFGLPILQLIDIKKTNIQAVILAPTRELGQQIFNNLNTYKANSLQISIAGLFGGIPIKPQIERLKDSTHIIVATPGRLADLLDRDAIHLKDITYFVLDEADEMLSAHKESVDAIIKALPKKRRTLLFTATMPGAIKQMVQNYMSKHVVHIKANMESVGHQGIDHKYIVVKPIEKLDVLLHFLNANDGERGIIFCKTKAAVNKLAKKLAINKFSSGAIHGSLTQGIRDRIMGQFREGHISILVATDLASRGIDVKNLSWVINYHLPDTYEAYVHRSGRTARAGANGLSLTIIQKEEIEDIGDFEKELDISFTLFKKPEAKSIEDNNTLLWAKKIFKAKPNRDVDETLKAQIKTIFHHLTKEELVDKILANYLAQTSVSNSKLDEVKKKKQVVFMSDNENNQDIENCIAILQKLVEDTNQLFELPETQRVALYKVAGELSRPNRHEFKRRRKDAKKAAKRKMIESDKHARKTTGIRSAREATLFVAPKLLAAAVIPEDTPELESPRNCYVCKTVYTKLHHFYDTMCTDCGDLNYAKRFQTTDLKNQVAVITGSRLKIGYHITLMLLRSGATVVATTRFPADSAIRFSKEEDYKTWSDRLHIHGLDLRHIPSVEIFCNYIEQKYERLDILINNAAQTVRRPSGFYFHLMENEKLPIDKLPKLAQTLLKDHESCLAELSSLSIGPSKTDKNNVLPVTWHGPEPGIGLRNSAELSQIPYSFDNSLQTAEVFPEGELDADLQQVDLRKTNSWRLKLGEIETTEMVEVQLVNAVAPFVLCNRLSNIMMKENTGKKHIINVSAMEGKFHRFKKEDRHPHTNMAKAALNMLTHTSAATFAKSGIYMNAVDTGWVTDEDPAALSKKKVEVHDFQPPLDIVDGAARVMDPLIDGINTGKHWCGKFLKDYFPIDW